MKNSELNIYEMLKKANHSFLKENYEEALGVYNYLMEASPHLFKYLEIFSNKCKEGIKLKESIVKKSVYVKNEIINEKLIDESNKIDIYLSIKEKIPAYIEKLTLLNGNSNNAHLKEMQKAKKRILKIFIGTLYSGENEFESSLKSIKNQSYPIHKHLIIKNKPNIEAHNTLYESFLQSDSDILIKIDADMVLTENIFFERIVNLVIWSKNIAIFQIAIHDYFSGRAIQGINVYTKLFNWDSNVTDPIFTDRSKLKSDQKFPIWAGFTNSVIHSPNPSNFQSFHFGVHRALKFRESIQRNDYINAVEQLEYLFGTYHHYNYRKSENLKYACCGAFLTLNGAFSTDQLDYTNNELSNCFEESIYNKYSSDKVDELLDNFISSDLRYIKIYDDISIEKYCVNSICLIVPHLDTFGGILRFLEISRVFKSYNINVKIASISLENKAALVGNIQFENIDIISIEEALKINWDVVVCGDFSSGLFLTLPLFKTKYSCVYLLNGWQHRYINLQQLKLIKPELYIANSSYVAKHYAELSPVVIPGGIDLQVFQKEEYVVKKSLVEIHIFVPVGRKKPRKRFIDAYKACQKLSSQHKITLHTMCKEELEDLSTDKMLHVHHINISRSELSTLLLKMDICIFPEEDAGWNNPAAEAMAVGCPTVCTDAGTVDFAIDHETAILFPARDVHFIVVSVNKLIASYELRKYLSENSRKIMKSFSWYNVANKLLDIFDQTLKASSYRAVINNNIVNKIKMELLND